MEREWTETKDARGRRSMEEKDRKEREKERNNLLLAQSEIWFWLKNIDRHKSNWKRDTGQWLQGGRERKEKEHNLLN